MNAQTRLLRQPDISDVRIVFACAADLWIEIETADHAHGPVEGLPEARRLTHLRLYV